MNSSMLNHFKDVFTCKSWTFAILVILLLGNGHAAAQPSPAGVWISLGRGFVDVANQPGFTDTETINMNVSYGFERKRFAYQAAFDYTSHFTFGGDPRYYMISLSPMAGKRTADRYYVLTQFVGPSFMYYKDEAPDGPALDATRSVALGAAFSAQFYVKPLAFVIPEIGLGAELFGNLNTHRNYYGIRISLYMSNGN